MPRKLWLGTRVCPETKQLVASLASRQGLSDSAWLRQLIELTLHSASAASPQALDSVAPARRTARFAVRLRHEDGLLLSKRARARGLAAGTYASVFIRAHLRRLAPLPEAELLALKRLVAELGAVGRNLKQIAKAANSPGAIDAPHRDDLQAFLKICEGLRDHVKRLLKANLASWEAGHAETTG